LSNLSFSFQKISLRGKEEGVLSGSIRTWSHSNGSTHTCKIVRPPKSKILEREERRPEEKDASAST
jgi:hypothetical protein